MDQPNKKPAFGAGRITITPSSQPLRRAERVGSRGRSAAGSSCFDEQVIKEVCTLAHVQTSIAKADFGGVQHGDESVQPGPFPAPKADLRRA